MNEKLKELLMHITSNIVRFFWTAPLYGDCALKGEKQLLWCFYFNLLKNSYEKNEEFVSEDDTTEWFLDGGIVRGTEIIKEELGLDFSCLDVLNQVNFILLDMFEAWCPTVKSSSNLQQMTIHETKRHHGGTGQTNKFYIPNVDGRPFFLAKDIQYAYDWIMLNPDKQDKHEKFINIYKPVVVDLFSIDSDDKKDKNSDLSRALRAADEMIKKGTLTEKDKKEFEVRLEKYKSGGKFNVNSWKFFTTEISNLKNNKVQDILKLAEFDGWLENEQLEYGTREKFEDNISLFDSGKKKLIDRNKEEKEQYDLNNLEDIKKLKKDYPELKTKEELK